SVDVTEDQRNSFSPADQQLLANLTAPLSVTVHLAPEDPRYADFQRNVLAKLERVMPRISIRLAEGRRNLGSPGTDEAYGEVAYAYDNRTDMSRSTSHREVLPLIYRLARVEPPAPASGADYPGYPLIANAEPALAWFFGGLPLLIGFAWWWSRLPPSITMSATE